MKHTALLTRYRRHRWPYRAGVLTVVSLLAGPASAADLLTISRDALEHNSTLASARAQFGGVQAGVDLARADLRPQLEASGEITHDRQYESPGSSLAGTDGRQDEDYNGAALTLAATQELYDARNGAELERAERQLDQQTYRLAATEQQVLVDVGSAYFDILRAHEVLEARRAQQRAIGRQLEQAGEQFEVGLIAITEVEEARARFDQSRAERITAESNLQVSFEALERLTGERYDSLATLQAAMPVIPPTPRRRDDWVAMAMERNPLVLASQAGVKVSRSGVDVARAKRLPVIEAFARYQFSDDDREELDGHTSASQVGARVSLPLYTGGRTSADIRQSTYALEASQYDLEDRRRETIRRVRSLFTQVHNDVATVEARAQAIVSNQSALEATRAGYEVGTRNIVDVLNAEQNLYDAVAAHAEARLDHVINRLNLHQQAGSLDVDFLATLNGWLTAEAAVSVSPSAPDA